MSYGLKRSSILKNKNDISFLFKEGNIYKSSLFIIRYKKNGLKKNRYAVLVSKKNGSAVLRNKLKRVYREMYKNTLNIDSYFFDIVIRPNIGTNANYFEISREFIKWWENVKM